LRKHSVIFPGRIEAWSAIDDRSHKLLHGLRCAPPIARTFNEKTIGVVCLPALENAVPSGPAAWRGLFEVQMARASTGHIDLKPFLNTIKYSAIFKA
jgi:hypothetical protein